MSHCWSKSIDFQEIPLVSATRSCPACGHVMRISKHRCRRLYTLDGPICLILKRLRCPNDDCAISGTFGPEQEADYALPRWLIGWDVFCWIGHRRFARHWAIPQIRKELEDSYGICLSDDAIEDYTEQYQTMVATYWQDMKQLDERYADTDEIILSIDGLQPEKGHETLYVVRELTRRRVLFAEPLLSSATVEVRRLIVRAKELAQAMNKRVMLWMSDKQDAFVTCIAEEFPDAPHRYCENHFFRDLAKPVLEMDSTAKKKMRGKVRGLRAIERTILDIQNGFMDRKTVPAADGEAPEAVSDNEFLGEGGSIVLDYCSVIRGILNDNHGGPQRPPGIRMLDALDEVSRSLTGLRKPARDSRIHELLMRLNACIEKGVADQQETFERVRFYTNHVCRVIELLSPDAGDAATREQHFEQLQQTFQNHSNDVVFIQMSKLMKSFRPGLFIGEDVADLPRDNLALERWFRHPKSHERKIHGHQHAGKRIVQEGPTLLPTLDAHLWHPGLFTPDDLMPYADASIPAAQAASRARHKIMLKARSQKKEKSCSEN